MIYLERHEGDENIHRFYILELGRDLFDRWVLTRRWGRIGTGQGRTLLQSFANKADAMAAEAHLSQQKQQRGYAPA